MTPAGDVQHEPTRSHFKVDRDEGQALLSYRLNGKEVIFLHTDIPAALEGQGIAGRLAKAGLEWARSNGYEVVAQCPFMASYIRKHPEWQTW
jgi:predicted GNAT family acetyltransferase